MTQLRRSAADYYAMHHEAIRDQDYAKRVEASWGLTAGGVDSMPFLLRMLRSDHADSREDAAGVLSWIGESSPEVVDAMLETLRSAVTHEERDSLILGLGELRAREAVPALAAILRDLDGDGDTRDTAVGALGKIVRRRFAEQPDPIGAALEWLERHPP